MTPSGAEAKTPFAIDVDAELVRLCRDRFPASWQLPAELVRIAHRRGATGLEIHLERSVLHVGCEAALLAPDDILALRAVLDARALAGVRHDALVHLESEGLTAFAACLVLPASRASLATGGSGGRLLERAPGGWRLDAHAPAAGDAGTRLTIEGLRWDHRRATAWLATACRFARPDVLLDGACLPRGFDDALAQAELPGPPSARIAIRAEGDAPSLALLWDGVLATRGTLLGMPPFGAAIEMRGMASGPESGAALRAALGPHVPLLVEQAVALMLAAATHPSHSRTSGAPRLARLLLEAMRAGIRADEIAQAPVLPFLGRDLAGGRTSVGALRARVAAGRPVVAIAHGDEGARHALPHDGALVLEPAARTVLSEALGVAIRTPPLRPRPSLSERVRTLLRRLRESLPFSRPGPRIPDAALHADERLLLGRLSPLLDPWERPLAVSAGSARPARASDGTLLLPRRSPRVAHLTTAVSLDERLAYVGALALLDGDGTPDREARERWLESLEV